jgi:hypothetical protein
MVLISDQAPPSGLATPAAGIRRIDSDGPDTACA